MKSKGEANFVDFGNVADEARCSGFDSRTHTRSGAFTSSSVLDPCVGTKKGFDSRCSDGRSRKGIQRSKLKSHSADDDAHGARRCEKSGLANEIFDRSKGYANRRGSELSQLPFAEKSICVQLGRFSARNRGGNREREGSVVVS